jgi:hypothetical protein
MKNKDYINSLQDIMICLQTMIHTRFHKRVKIIFTDGKYKSAYTSFYKSYTWQFYVENKVSYYKIYLLKNERIIRHDIIRMNESIERFYQKMIYFFRLI